MTELMITYFMKGTSILKDDSLGPTHIYIYLFVTQTSYSEAWDDIV